MFAIDHRRTTLMLDPVVVLVEDLERSLVQANGHQMPTRRVKDKMGVGPSSRRPPMRQRLGDLDVLRERNEARALSQSEKDEC